MKKGFFNIESGKKKTKRTRSFVGNRLDYGGIGSADKNIVEKIKQILDSMEGKNISEKIETINAIKLLVHQYSPFCDEPVDCVLWVRNEEVFANDYNPNSVAPPEMKLLEHSIDKDGYTQPIVAWKKDDVYEVVDGFHRNRVGRESKKVCSRIYGYLPLSIINTSREDRNDRISSTIRHNRARGKHRVEAMSDIVIELKKRNWTDNRIGKELGMEPDEVLRLCQINGLVEMFSDTDFSKSWEANIFDDNIDGSLLEDDED